MKPNDVVGFEAGLHAGMHICKASNRAKAAFKKALHEVSVYFLVGTIRGSIARSVCVLPNRCIQALLAYSCIRVMLPDASQHVNN